MELGYLSKMYTNPHRSNVFNISGQTSVRAFDLDLPYLLLTNGACADNKKDLNILANCSPPPFL